MKCSNCNKKAFGFMYHARSSKMHHISVSTMVSSRHMDSKHYCEEHLIIESKKIFMIDTLSNDQCNICIDFCKEQMWQQ